MTPEEDIAARAEAKARYNRAAAVLRGFLRRKSEAIERTNLLRKRIAQDQAELADILTQLHKGDTDEPEAIAELEAAEDAYRTTHNLRPRTKRIACGTP
jgi:cytochrome c-type biogenesis protein CcmH/NrfG